MSRVITVGAAQLGPIQRADSRPQVVKRLLELLHQAKAHGCDLVVFPELALTTFFPRWWMTDQAEIDAFFEREMPGSETLPLFDEARRLGIGFYLGYAELVTEGRVSHRFNTSILVDQAGRIAGKYRKIHLPGHALHEPRRASSKSGSVSGPGISRSKNASISAWSSIHQRGKKVVSASSGKTTRSQPWAFA